MQRGEKRMKRLKIININMKKKIKNNNVVSKNIVLVWLKNIVNPHRINRGRTQCRYNNVKFVIRQTHCMDETN